ncbi:phosphoribosylformylglycinamidine cyclo-ligase [bacterium]|nr:phosphoribosylformylglycinamidine cyclo-ligase [bacterium]NCQ55685.1 phosphoribosylformylglycinamidine cyclo-ligase [Candidatus Parcubacteria bacterium]NCS67634.1 phosphoribosylformylglycinamidine cyclo-ligase [Candidatus Peregrinibacteria bacterium]NCS96648.1 phosphoribosylformylglycinamidine cyclo-ligase [bacterium]
MSHSYASAGVNIEAGDAASKAAYQNAKTTFSSRKGLIGEPFALEGGFSGALDMGDYLLIQNDDGVGTKLEIAERTGIYDTLGEDLVCMVADDAICVGAETISITNTFDVPKVDPVAIKTLTDGLAKACIKEKIVIPGGEIAELGNALNRMVWNATAVGVVKKDKFITGKDIKPGQVVIGLKGRVIRSNGTSLARRVCESTFGENWHQEPFNEEKSWGEVLLTPSKIFHRLLLDTVLGDFNGPRKFNVYGLAHITGGGVPGNLPRILPEGLGADLPNLHTPHEAVLKLQELGQIDEAECYRTWHCGTAMMLVCDEDQADKICAALNEADKEVEAQVIGKVTDTPRIKLNSKFSGKSLDFAIK